MVVIVLPTHNEAAIIRANLERLLAFLSQGTAPTDFNDRGKGWDRPSTDQWRVIIADNASTDATRAIVREVAARESSVELLEIPEVGKGGAVLAAWQKAAGQMSNVKCQMSPVFVFMDADLATDLAALPALISAIRNGPPSRNAPAREPADIAVGSRYLPGSRTERGSLRRLTSWCYRLLLRLLFSLHVSDPPCGFKAVNERVVREIAPLVRDRQWFFDTELLIRAQAAGMHIAEVPVTWHEPRRDRSFGKVLRITWSDLLAMWRLRRELRA